MRAALESMAYQTKEVFDLMSKESRLQIKSLAVDGGACRNNFLMQFQADMLAIPIVRPSMVDSTVAGAAYLAGVSIGLWDPRMSLRSKRSSIFSSRACRILNPWLNMKAGAMPYGKPWHVNKFP